MDREKSGDLKRALMVVTVKSIYFFKPYVKRCQVCPIDKVCWDPSPVMDPIPLTNIQTVIDMEALPMFALLLTIKEGLFSKGGEQVYLIQVDDHYSKKNMINNIIESCPVDIIPDPIFKSLVFDENGTPPLISQIVGVSTSDIEVRASAFSGEIRIKKPYLMLVTESTVKFYKVNYKYWIYTEAPKKALETYEELLASAAKKTNEKKVTNKQLEEIMKYLLVEDKSFTNSVSNLSTIREKEDKEPILLLGFPKVKLHVILNSDFAMQSIINTMIQILNPKK